MALVICNVAGCKQFFGVILRRILRLGVLKTCAQHSLKHRTCIKNNNNNIYYLINAGNRAVKDIFVSESVELKPEWIALNLSAHL